MEVRVNEFSRPLMCRVLQKCFFHIFPIKAHLTSAIVTELLTEAGQKKTNCQMYMKAKDVSTTCKGIKQTDLRKQHLV